MPKYLCRTRAETTWSKLRTWYYHPAVQMMCLGCSTPLVFQLNKAHHQFHWLLTIRLLARCPSSLLSEALPLCVKFWTHRLLGVLGYAGGDEPLLVLSVRQSCWFSNSPGRHETSGWHQNDGVDLHARRLHGASELHIHVLTVWDLE